MTLQFKKGKKGKASAFACIREDGSATYQRIVLPAEHDLLHFAVETTMGWRDAFLGMVAAGRDLDEFGTKNGVKDVYTHEEVWAEVTVGSLQWPALSEGGQWTDEELLEMNRQACLAQNFPPPPVTLSHFRMIRSRGAELHRQWRELPEGETMELTFLEC